MSEPQSLRAYARHRACALSAVQRAIDSGRLYRSVTVVEGVRKISDFALADREWSLTTDPAKVRGPAALADFKVTPLRGLQLVDVHYEDPTADEEGDSSFVIGIEPAQARRLGQLLIAAASEAERS